ncbi:UNVERIFIED_CONTAM: hypothetical protein GTU68_010884 [Idotea baltica]|nr:hypothetical protein [Idotea baltica]
MNNEEEFLLKWNNHQSNLIGVFKEWLRDESFVDVTLVCGGEAVSGHKVVLAACSPLLNRILHDNPCRHPVVILNNVCSGDMKALLKFIYQGEVSVSQSELASFLRTADNLQIKGLAEDKEKDDRKRKEKDSDVTGEIRKKRKTEFKVSSQHSQVYNKNLDSVSSSPKSRKNHSPHRDKISSLNSHQTPSGGVRSNSVNNQMVINTDSISHTLEAEYEQSSEQHYKNEELVS